MSDTWHKSRLDCQSLWRTDRYSICWLAAYTMKYILTLTERLCCKTDVRILFLALCGSQAANRRPFRLACIRSDASIVRAMHTEGHVAACHTVCMPKRSNNCIVKVLLRQPEWVRRLRREPLLHRGLHSAREALTLLQGVSGVQDFGKT